MCGRYSLATPNPAEVRAAYPIGDEVEIRRRFNVAPGDPVLAVTTDREGRPRGELLRWGLVPPWARAPETGLKMINARVETVTDRPAYRGALERFRCLVVADGFYEWRRDPAGGPKQAFWITRKDGGMFAFAGLWSAWRRDEGAEPLRTCTILTTAANPAVAPLHDRMPVILPQGGEATWLDAGTRWDSPSLSDALAGLPACDTALMPVGSAVNDARYDGPECLAPPVESAQATLF